MSLQKNPRVGAAARILHEFSRKAVPGCPRACAAGRSDPGTSGTTRHSEESHAASGHGETYHSDLSKKELRMEWNMRAVSIRVTSRTRVISKWAATVPSNSMIRGSTDASRTKGEHHETHRMDLGIVRIRRVAVVRSASERYERSGAAGRGPFVSSRRPASPPGKRSGRPGPVTGRVLDPGRPDDRIDIAGLLN